MPELSITIVNWNGLGFLPACLRSIAANPPGVSYEVIVVDNLSSDGSREWLGSIDAAEIFPEDSFKVILNDDNIGFGRAHNIAIRSSASEYVLILNPDAIVKAGAINRLIQSLVSDDRIGAVAPKLLTGDGNVQVSVALFPLNPFTILASSMGLPRILPRKLRSKFFGKYWGYNEELAVPAFAGAAIVAKRKAIDEVGAFDEDFFMYYEDFEWCARFNRNGWKTVFVPDAEIIHLIGGSSKQRWTDGQTELRLWEAEILANKKSLPRIVATANALVNAGIFSLGYIRCLLLRRETGIRAQRLTLQFKAVKDGLSFRHYRGD